MNTENIKEKLKNKLKEIFQIEDLDLDFGIYKIMRYKKEEIEKFIEKDLIEETKIQFNLLSEEERKNKENELEELKTKLIDLGVRDYQNNEKYQQKLKDIEQIKVSEDLERDIYNHILKFFSRYYDNGDFISQKRYGKDDKYLIPYNGEETKLYWANYEQYYVKTTEFFRRYLFEVGDLEVNFRVVEAEEEKSNIKSSEKKFFLLNEKRFKLDNNVLNIYFDYRGLTEKEEIKYGKRNVQKNVNEEICNEITNFVEKEYKKNQNLLLLTKKQNQDEKSIIEKKLYHYTRRNTSDYFIHKDLKSFLERELDFYIKTEVVNIEDVSKLDVSELQKYSLKIKVIKNIADKIIEFVSQIENFQKKLWEKKKFVLKTEYVITVDRISEEFYEEIIKNKKQLEEWEELGFEIDGLKASDLKYKKLPIDTKYFNQDFKERLLEKLTEKENLDDLIDGILIKSENYQALNLILEKYKDMVKSIYIDPPYNTGNDEFLYKDRYQHSSWLSMMKNRLKLAKDLMNREGVIFISMGDLNPQEGESYRLQILLNEIFEKRYGNLIWKKRGGIGSFSEKDLTENHEYITVNGRASSFIYNNILSEKKIKDYKYKDERGIFRWMDLIGPSQQTKERRPNLNYGVLYYVSKNKMVGFEYFYKGSKRREYFDENRSENIYSIWLEGKATWLISREILEKYYKKGLISIFHEGNKYKVKIKNYLYKSDGTIDGDILKSILLDNGMEIGMNVEATKNLRNLFPSLDTSSLNPKPVSLVKFLVYVTCIKNEIILDFFAGSGTTAHAVMKLNKEDRENRKFILVEISDYFDTVIISRIKKIAYSFNWEDGKPQNIDGIGVFFKYQYLEQYEDALENIEFTKPQQELKFDDYLLRYILDFEAKDAQTFLNIDNMEDPFSYKLKVIKEYKQKEVDVDLPETYNYLIGLKVNKVKFLKNDEDNNRQYLFITGERNNNKVLVIWRNRKNLEPEKDKNFILRYFELKDFNEVHINGDSVLSHPNIIIIEAEFKKLLFPKQV